MPSRRLAREAELRHPIKQGRASEAKANRGAVQPPLRFGARHETELTSDGGEISMATGPIAPPWSNVLRGHRSGLDRHSAPIPTNFLSSTLTPAPAASRFCSRRCRPAHGLLSAGFSRSVTAWVEGRSAAFQPPPRAWISSTAALIRRPRIWTAVVSLVSAIVWAVITLR